MSTQTPLAPTLATLRTSISLLNSSLSILSTGTQDLPRLTRVLHQTRHFELAPASALTTAQAAVLSELVPEVDSLLARVEKVVAGRERREEWLRARWALGQGRLGGEHEEKAERPRRKSGAGEQRKGDEAKARRLRQKKERLSYAVERLTLQAGQRERQLRMSMAAQEARAGEEEEAAGEEEAEDDF